MKKIIFIVAFFAYSLQCWSQGGVPKTIGFQGYLTDKNSGDALNGNFDMKFSLYDTPTGGAELWFDDFAGVVVAKGSYALILGDKKPITLPFDKIYYLQIKVGLENLDPRITMTSSPYSLSATNASTITAGTLNGSLVGSGINASNITVGSLSGSIVGVGVSASSITVGTIDNGRLHANLQDLADGTLSGDKVGSGIDAQNISAGMVDNARLDPNLQDLADGTLSGAKIGTGINASNISEGTLNSTVLPAGAITANKLQSDPSVDANRAVTTEHIRDNAILTEKLALNAVTSTKLQGDPTVDANRAVTANHVRDNAITSMKIDNNAVTAGKLQSDASIDANRAVTSDHLRDNAITVAKVAANAITAAKLQSDASLDANRAVNSDHIRDNAIIGSKIAGNAVTTTKLQSDAAVDANRAVNTNHIRDNAVTTSKLNANAVTSAKLQSDAVTDANRAVTTDHVRDNAIVTAKIANGTIVDADINGTAAISGTKISPSFGSQNLSTTGSITATLVNSSDYMTATGGLTVGNSYDPGNHLSVVNRVGIGITPAGTLPTVALDVEGSTSLAVVRIKKNSGLGTEMVEFYRQSNPVSGIISEASGNMTYGPFTGTHFGMSRQAFEIGTLVSFTGRLERTSDNPDSEPIYEVTATSMPNDPKVLGSYLHDYDPIKFPQTKGMTPQAIMAVGNGIIWISDNGQDIEVGDYLISSTIGGHAMKEDGTYEIAYIIARAAEIIRWADVTESVDGVKHKKISVLYENFILDKAVHRLAEKVEALDKKLEAMMREFARLESEVFRTKSSIKP